MRDSARPWGTLSKDTSNGVQFSSRKRCNQTMAANWLKIISRNIIFCPVNHTLWACPNILWSLFDESIIFYFEMIHDRLVFLLNDQISRGANLCAWIPHCSSSKSAIKFSSFQFISLNLINQYLWIPFSMILFSNSFSRSVKSMKWWKWIIHWCLGCWDEFNRGLTICSSFEFHDVGQYESHHN